MTLSERIKVLVRLGEHLNGKDEYLEAVMVQSQYNNGWFTIENQAAAVKAIANEFLEEEKLLSWVDQYHFLDNLTPKKIGLVLAGNLPLVGFHDVLCVFTAGHIAQIKLSDKDKFLLPYFLKLLERFDGRTTAYFEVVQQLSGFEVIIATGSNNSARYFESYFGKYPHIIRRNRNGIAVLRGDESEIELRQLGEDVFRFYGLGCRNVSKIYVPEGYDFDPLLSVLHEFRGVILNSKYKNNFDHNYALFILNKVQYRGNGCVLMTESDSFQSPIACLYYSYYQSFDRLEREFQERKDEIQCVVGKDEFSNLPTLPFGKAQEPSLTDYADGVDVMEFLIALE